MNVTRAARAGILPVEPLISRKCARGGEALGMLSVWAQVAGFLGPPRPVVYLRRYGTREAEAPTASCLDTLTVPVRY